MKAWQRLTLAIILLLGIAGSAGLLGNGLLNSLYAYESPLKGADLAQATSTGSPATRRVVFVLIDGLRLDTALDSGTMPTLASLRQQGAWASMHSFAPSLSQPGYSILFTGAWQEINSGPVFNNPEGSIPTWSEENLFSLAQKAGYQVDVSAYFWFNELIPADSTDHTFYTPGDDREADTAVMQAALPWLDDSGKQFILIHLDQVDYAGHHEGGANDPNWSAAASRVDAYLGDILAKLDLSQDTLVVCSDHGHTDQGGHGGSETDVLTEPLLLAGAGIQPGTHGDVNMVDLAPTLAALMGMPLPGLTQGVVRSDMLNLPSETLAKLPAATKAQQEQLLNTYAQAIGQAANSPTPASDTPEDIVTAYQAALQSLRKTRLQQEQLPRIATAVIAWVALLLILFRQKTTRLMLAGGAVYLVLFAGTYLLFEGTVFSYSSLGGASDLILSVLAYSVIALGAGLMVAFIGTDRSLLQPIQFRLRIASASLVIAYMVCLPALLNYAFNWIGSTWYMPDPAITYLGLFSLVQVLAVSLLGAFFSLPVISVFRKHPR